MRLCRLIRRGREAERDWPLWRSNRQWDFEYEEEVEELDGDEDAEEEEEQQQEQY